MRVNTLAEDFATIGKMHKRGGHPIAYPHASTNAISTVPPSPQPRYRLLAATLAADIESGRYPIGSRLPIETELCVQFGASRFTVREAMRQLVEMGLVTRQTSLGTRVVATQARRGYQQVMQRLSDLSQYTVDAKLQILETRTVVLDEDRAKLLQGKVGQHWLQADSVRHTGPQPPICWVDVYIHPAFRSLNGLRGTLDKPIYTLIEQQFGERVVELQQRIEPTMLGAAMARRLEATPRSAALRVVRHYLNQAGDVVMASDSVHPQGRYSYSQSFRLETAPGQ